MNVFSIMQSCSHNRIIKLPFIKPLFVTQPRRWRHAAVRIQQDTNASNHQKHQQQHQESHKAQGRSLIGVSRHGLQRCGAPGEPSWSRRGDLIVHGPVSHLSHAGGRGIPRTLKCPLVGFVKWLEAAGRGATLHGLLCNKCDFWGELPDYSQVQCFPQATGQAEITAQISGAD